MALGVSTLVLRLKFELSSLFGVPDYALNVESMTTVKKTHLFAGVKSQLVGRLEFFIRLIIKGVGSDDRRANKRALPGMHEQLKLLLLVPNLLIQEPIALIALSVPEKYSICLIMTTVFESGSDLQLCGLICVEQHLCVATDFCEDVLYHFAELRKFQVLIMADHSVKENLKLNVVETLLDNEVEARLEEVFKVFDVIVVFYVGGLKVCLLLLR